MFDISQELPFLYQHNQNVYLAYFVWNHNFVDRLYFDCVLLLFCIIVIPILGICLPTSSAAQAQLKGPATDS